MPRESKPLWHNGNQCWYARVGDPDEKGRSRPVYFNKPLENGVAVPRDRRDEAGAWVYFNALRRRREARWVNKSDPTVRGLTELYLSACQARVEEKTMAVGHLRTLMTRLGKFTDFKIGGAEIGERRAGAVSVDDMAEWMKFLKIHHKPHYVKNCVRGVQSVYAWASREEPGREPRQILPRNPIASFRAPSAGRMPERFAQRSEAAAFLRFFRTDARTRFDRLTILLERVLIRTGCRPGEACAMRWDQIRWDAGVTSIGHRFAKVILEEHKTAEKTEKLRTIYLTPSLTRALRRVSSQPGKHPTHVFVHARGSRSVAAMETPADLGDPWNSIALAAKVRKVRERAIRAAESLQSEGKPTRGLELLSGKGANRLVNYRWRHTAISTLLMMGVDVATVAELTGTSPEMIHQHYGHLLDAHLAGAAEKLIRGRRA